MDPISLLLVLLALIVGAALGWLFASRHGSKAGATADLLRMTLDEVTKERDAERGRANAAAQDLAALQADARNFEARMKELLEAKEALTAQFHEVGAKLLSDAQKQFLERADSRFNQASEKSEAQLKALLQPVEATLKRYEEGLSKVEKDRVGSYEALREAVTCSTPATPRSATRPRSWSARLPQPQSRGRWGEQSEERARTGRPLPIRRFPDRGFGGH